LSDWIRNFLQEDDAYYGDAEDDNYIERQNDPLPGGDSDGMYDDVIDDGLIESFIIMGLAAALVFLIYYRQQHQLAHRQNEEARARQGGEGQQEQPQDRGVFPQPGDPEFGQWVAGGVGH
jgi:SEL1 protein